MSTTHFGQENRDVMTKLRVRTNAGRPNWPRVFTKLRDADRGKVGALTNVYPKMFLN